MDDFPDLKEELEEAAERQVISDIRRGHTESNPKSTLEALRANPASIHASCLSTIEESSIRSENLDGISVDSFAGAPNRTSSNSS